MKQNLAAVPSLSIEKEQARRAEIVARDAGTFIDNVRQVKDSVPRVMSLVIKATDEMIASLFQAAEEMGGASWQIEDACCHVMLRRAHLRKQAGEPLDFAARDIKEVVEAVAAKLGCHWNSVYQGAKRYQTFLASDAPKEVLACQNLLPRKRYYDEALRSDDPRYAIVEMAREKEKNAFFNTGRARAFVEKLNTEVIETEIVLPPELQQQEYEDRRDKIEHVLQVIAADFLAEPCPPALADIFKVWQHKMRFEKRRSPEKENRRVLAAIRADCNVVDDIALATLLSVREVRAILVRLESAGLIDREKRGGQTEVSRGDREDFYTLKGEVTGEAYIAPRAVSRYQPTTA